jgi:hypothetical protein
VQEAGSRLTLCTVNGGESHTRPVNHVIRTCAFCRCLPSSLSNQIDNYRYSPFVFTSNCKTNFYALRTCSPSLLRPFCLSRSISAAHTELDCCSRHASPRPNFTLSLFSVCRHKSTCSMQNNSRNRTAPVPPVRSRGKESSSGVALLSTKPPTSSSSSTRLTSTYLLLRSKSNCCFRHSPPNRITQSRLFLNIIKVNSQDGRSRLGKETGSGQVQRVVDDKADASEGSTEELFAQFRNRSQFVDKLRSTKVVVNLLDQLTARNSL